MATIAEYPDAVRRILNSDVPADATSRDAVRQALRDSNTPQITDKVAAEMADAALTEDKVIEALESGDSLPAKSEIGTTADAFDDYDQPDRVAEVTASVGEQVATVEDVEGAVRERQESTDGPTFREDVQDAVDSVAADKDFVGADADDVTEQQAQEIGAPSEDAYRQAAVDAVRGDSVVPADDPDIASDATTPVPTVTDQSGDVVGVQVAGSTGAAEAVAEARDAEVVGGVDEFGLDQEPGRARLTLDGREVGEVDL